MTPPNINLPEAVPSLVIDPAPLITLDTVIPPVDVIPNVTPLVFVNAPVWNVNTPPAVLLILEALNILMGPEIVASDPLIILIAPFGVVSTKPNP